jgi:hypothetical protein
MSNLSQKEMAEHGALESTCWRLSNRESLSLFRLIKRMVLETMLQANLRELKNIEEDYLQQAGLLYYERCLTLAAAVARKKEAPSAGEFNDE